MLVVCCAACMADIDVDANYYQPNKEGLFYAGLSGRAVCLILAANLLVPCGIVAIGVYLGWLEVPQSHSEL